MDVLLATPWQLSAGFAVTVFIALKWIIPAMASGNMILKAVAVPLSQIAWLFGGFFLLIAGIRYPPSTGQVIQSSESACTQSLYADSALFVLARRRDL